MCRIKHALMPYFILNLVNVTSLNWSLIERQNKEVIAYGLHCIYCRINQFKYFKIFISATNFYRKTQWYISIFMELKYYYSHPRDRRTHTLIRKRIASSSAKAESNAIKLMVCLICTQISVVTYLICA